MSNSSANANCDDVVIEILENAELSERESWLRMAKSTSKEFVDNPQFRGLEGSYQQAPSGAGAYTLLAFLTNYAAINAERSAKIYELFKNTAIDLRRRGLTHRTDGRTTLVPNCRDNVLCIGMCVPESGVRWFATITYNSNTGPGAPGGSILYRHDSTTIVTGVARRLRFTVLGETLCSLGYADNDAGGINFDWWPA